MDLELVYDSKDAIPAGFDALYAERDGKFQLTGIRGLKTQADVDAVQTGLRKEREEHKATKEKFAPFSQYDPVKLADDLAELETLRVTGGKVDNSKIEDLVAARLAKEKGPLTREMDQMRKDLEAATMRGDGLQKALNTRIIGDAVREAALGEKVVPEALEDILLYGERLFEITEDGKVITKEGVGVTPGLDAKTWLKDMTKTRPHWWPQSTGGGANGQRGGGMSDNPWTPANWNLSKQGEYVRLHGLDKAQAAAKAAGSAVGATTPPKA